MKIRHLFILVVLALLSACNTNVIDYEVIKVINHYEQNEKNIQLGKDFLYYNYTLGLAELIDGFNEEDAKNIRWEYFIKESDKEVSFRLKLNAKNPTILKNREKIIAYFKKEVEKNYQFHIENEQLFSQAADFSNAIYSHIDNGEFEEIWSKCNEIITAKTNKDTFISNLKQGTSETGPAISRELTSKQYYRQPIEGKDSKLFVLNFNTEFSKGKANEQLTLVLTDKWEVIGVRSHAM